MFLLAKLTPTYAQLRIRASMQLKLSTTVTGARRRYVLHHHLLPALALGLLLGGSAEAQNAPAAAATGTNDVTKLPTVTVTAQKIPQAANVVPVSVTAVPASVLQAAGVRNVEEAGIYSPSLYFTDFAPRKNSAPRFRGIGASPVNPGVTTYLDGVPQLNSNSSLQEFVGVDQVEFIRGPQSMLFGRNTVGGVINVTSRRPSTEWTSNGEFQYGNYNYRDIRGGVSGPLSDKGMALSLDGGYSAREGFTKNINTGHDLDQRDAQFGKAQLLFHPATDWEGRLILSAEHAKDGDYPLGDLNFIRANPHLVNFRNEGGYANRDIVSPTLQLSRTGGAVDFTSTTAGVWWKTFDQTDINYVGAAGGLNVSHYNQEEDFQFTQEFRLSSGKDNPIKLGDKVDLKWQTGLLVFTQNYQQDTGEPPFGTKRQVNLEDVGVGLYGQGTVTFFEKLDLIAGARFDHESRHTDARYSGAGAFSGDLDFSAVSPQAGLAYHLNDKQTVYASATRGYKAGGFNNATAPTLVSASTPFGKEYSWNYEVGYKGEFLDDRLKATIAAFYIDWSNLQLNNVLGATTFISNAGSAVSKGAEFEFQARPFAGVDVFGSFGYTDARYLSNAKDTSGSLAGKHVPYAPDYTASGGVQLSHALCEKVTAYARGEVAAYGNFKYDAANGAGQDAYNVANFRAGVRGKNWYAEGWVRNAFDTKYVPIAIPYTGFLAAPSGYVGESGAPVTFGFKVGANF